jgi:hypothetical protein
MLLVFVSLPSVVLMRFIRIVIVVIREYFISLDLLENFPIHNCSTDLTRPGRRFLKKERVSELFRNFDLSLHPDIEDDPPCLGCGHFVAISCALLCSVGSVLQRVAR